MADYPVNGRVALVTGGARGIGFATCEELVKRGATVVINDLHQSDCDDAAERLGGKAVGIAGDVTDKGGMQATVAKVVEQFGGLDIVVANAGIASKGATFNAMSAEAFERVYAVDGMGVVNTVDAALGQVIERRGHVVVISSVYAWVNGVGAMPYAMAKAAVEQFGRGLRVELAQHGASATVAHFGFIDTEMVRRGIDADPLVDQMLNGLPKPLHKRLDPKKAGAGIVDSIEGRKPRLILPKRWSVFYALRGILNPLVDKYMETDADTQAIARQLEDRASEEQPLTAD